MYSLFYQTKHKKNGISLQYWELNWVWDISGSKSRQEQTLAFTLAWYLSNVKSCSMCVCALRVGGGSGLGVHSLLSFFFLFAWSTPFPCYLSCATDLYIKVSLVISFVFKYDRILIWIVLAPCFLLQLGSFGLAGCHAELSRVSFRWW